MRIARRIGLGAACAAGFAWGTADGAHAEVRAGVSNASIDGTLSPSVSSALEPYVTFSGETGGPLVGDFWIFSSWAHKATGSAAAAIEFSRTGAGGQQSNERSAFGRVQDTVRISRDLGASGNGVALGVPDDGFVTVRLSFQRVGTAVAEMPPIIAPQSRARAGTRWVAGLSRQESSGPVGGSVTIVERTGLSPQVVLPGGEGVRATENWIELDIPENLVPFTGLGSYRLFLQAEAEALGSLGTVGPDSGFATSGIDVHIAVEQGWSWRTTNGVLLSSPVWIPPEFVPEPDGALAGLVAMLCMAGLARGRRRAEEKRLGGPPRPA